MSEDVFRRRADECRQLAAAASNAADKAFWLGMLERWQALEKGRAKSRSPKLRVIDGGPARHCYRRYYSGREPVLTIVS